jgi:hypothetical protein
LEETLGLHVTIVDGTAGRSSYTNVASGLVDANLEVWTAQKDRSLACASSCGGDGADLSRIGCAIERLHVFKGHVGAYVSYRNNSILQSHLVDFWRTYTNPEMLHLLPAANFSDEMQLADFT